VAATTPKRKPKPLVCNKCGALNRAGATACASCGSVRFAPNWVQHLRRVNSAFAVQVCEPHPASESKDPVLTLYKSFPTPKTFNIPSAAQWDAVRRIVETDLAPYLGWRTPAQTTKAAKQAAKYEKQTDAEFAALAEKDPKAIANIIRALRFADLSPEELPQLSEAIADIAETLVGLDARRRRAIQQIVKKLPEQGAKALNQLADLMEDLTVGQIAAVATEVQRRANLLNLFKERCLAETTYEIRGEGSIHRLLERAMWIVD
jgi:ribosomal protein L40E